MSKNQSRVRFDAIGPGPAESRAGADKQYVMRGGQRFEKRSSKPADEEESESKPTIHQDFRNTQSFFSRLFCPMNRPPPPRSGKSPDNDFCATSLIKLSHGITAYRLIEPSTATDENADTIPVIVCLHGMYNASYMWADVADLLCDCERGPNARVLVFDFYGRGRSPWSGVPCTLDVLVVQTKELLDCE